MSQQDQILKFFASFIEKELGIVYQEANYFQLKHRLENIAKQLGRESIEELFHEAQKQIGAELKVLLLDIATNNETSFFRDPAVFLALEKTVFPSIAERHPMTPIQMWSAASSSGQEAYSCAMAHAAAYKASSIPELKMLVSDISERILKRAEEGVYSQLEIQRGLPARLMLEHFEQLDGDVAGWKAKNHLRKGMSFKKLNLLDSFYGIGPFDVIMCRNVLIYQSVENKKMILDKIVKLLNPGGYLFLGAAESLLGLSEAFQQCSTDGAVYYQLK